MVVYVGIDPGKTGAFSVVVQHKKILKYGVYDIKHLEVLPIALKLKYATDVKIAIEKAQAMPGQGVVSMFNYGVEYGKILGMLQANYLEYEEIPPQTWKRKLGLTKDKEKSREMAIKMFPDLKDELSKKKDHNKAEALLLACYIIQQKKNP